MSKENKNIRFCFHGGVQSCRRWTFLGCPGKQASEGVIWHTLSGWPFLHLQFKARPCVATSPLQVFAAPAVSLCPWGRKARAAIALLSFSLRNQYFIRTKQPNVSSSFNFEISLSLKKYSTGDGCKAESCKVWNLQDLNPHPHPTPAQLLVQTALFLPTPHYIWCLPVSESKPNETFVGMHWKGCTSNQNCFHNKTNH